MTEVIPSRQRLRLRRRMPRGCAAATSACLDEGQAAGVPARDDDLRSSHEGKNHEAGHRHAAETGAGRAHGAEAATAALARAEAVEAQERPGSFFRRVAQRRALRREAAGGGAAARPRSRRPRLRAAAYFSAAVVGLVLLLACGLAVRMLMGPVVVEGLSQRVAHALAARLGPDWKVTVGSAAIEHAGFNPALRVDDVVIRNPEGQRALRAPTAAVAVDPWALVFGRFTPRTVSFKGLDLRLDIAADGSLSFKAGSDADTVRGASVPQPLSHTAPGQGDGADAGEGAAAPSDGAASAAAAPTPGLPSLMARAASSAVSLLTEADGLFGGLDLASIENARLVLVGADGKERFQFDDVSLRFEKPKASLRHFVFGLKGPSGPWHLDGTVAGRSGEARIAQVSFDDIPVSDLLILGGGADGAIMTDMPLSGSIRVAVASDGGLSALDTELRGGRAVIHTNDPDMPHFTMNEVRLATAFDVPAGAVTIGTFYASWDESHIEASGRIERGEGPSPWRLTLRSTDAVAGPPTPHDRPLRLASVDMVASGVPGGGARIESVNIAAQEGSGFLTGEVGTEATGRGVRLTISGEDTKLRAALALWPSFGARAIRDHLYETAQAGLLRTYRVDVNMNAHDLVEARAKRPLPTGAVTTVAEVADGRYLIAPDLPVLRGSASVRVTATNARIEVSDASLPLSQGRTMFLPTGLFTIADSTIPAPIGKAEFRLTGGADALVALTREAALAPIDTDPAVVKGTADLRVAMTIPVGPHIAVKDVRTTATGTLANLTVDNVVGKDRLEGANLALVLDKAALTLKGDGRIAGLQAAIDLRQPLGDVAGEAVLTAMLDEAARAKRGINLGRQLTGPVFVRVAATLSNRDPKPPRVEVDLTKAKIDGIVPGWTKPANKAGKATFQVVTTQAGGHLLDDFVLDAGLVAKGQLELAASNGLQRAKLTQFKLSPADDMRLELERQGQGYRISIKGQVVDARPFIKAAIGDPVGGKPAKPSRSADVNDDDIALDMTTAILAGFNDEALTNVNLKLRQRDGDLKQLSMTGRFTRATASLQLTPGTKDAGSLVLSSDDAGALLRFADLYKRMSGGQLALQASLGEGQQSGLLTIREFALRNEPALRRIVAARPAGTYDERTGAWSPPINADDVAFTKLQAKFVRSATRVTLHDGIIWGPQVGIKLDGSVDFGRDRADLTGTFIPAYALNNAFSKIPLFGPILGGGTNEGVFAVSFRITGPASSPTLTVNPLTAVAPGILRKFIEPFTPDGSLRNAPAPAQTLGDR